MSILTESVNRFGGDDGSTIKCDDTKAMVLSPASQTRPDNIASPEMPGKLTPLY